jgi:hypothetical protein
MRKASVLFFVFILGFALCSAATVITGDISTDTTLFLSNNPHQIRGTVRVLNGATLTLEPGVTVLFENNSLLEIQGQISAMATADVPIVFSSISADYNYTKIYLNGAEGSTFNHCSFSKSEDNTALLRIVNSGTINLLNCNVSNSISGNGIYINNSTVNINACNITGVAQSGIHIEGDSSNINLFDLDISGCNKGVCVQSNNYPTLVMDDISVQNSNSYPLEAAVQHYANLTNLQISGPGIPMLAIWDSYLYSSFTLPNPNLPYRLLNNLNVSSGATLTLAPGAGLRFGQNGKLSFTAGANLVANGSVEQNITFNPAGSNTWKGISFDNGCSGFLDYCSFNGCGYPEYGYPEPSLSANNFNNLSISNTQLTGGTTFGIYITGSNAGTLTLNNVDIVNCPYTGLYINNSIVSLDYNNLSVSGCGRPLELPANLIDFLDQQPIFTSNSDNRIFIINSGYLYRNTTFRNWGYPFVFETVNLDLQWIALTIDPGCLIQFGYSLGVSCNGSISAMGTTEQPITFTRLPDSTQNWRGFYLASGTTNAHFNHCILEHCASSNQYNHIQDAFTIYRADNVLIENTQIIDAYCRAIFIDSANNSSDNLTLNNLTITGCGMDAIYQNASDYILSINGLSVSNCNAYPLSISGNWVHQLSNITLEQNAHNVIRLVNGGYLVSQTLANHGYPYQISGYPLYVNYTTVNLSPGTVFYFENSLTLEIYGTLNAPGTIENPIIFTRPPETSYYWQGLIFRNNSYGNLQHCIFSYGGKASEYGYDASFINNLGATTLSIQNCEINNVQAQAFSCSDIGSGDSLQIEDLQISGCGTDGFWCNDTDLNLIANGLSINSCGRNPMSIVPSLAGSIQNLSLSGNTNNNIRLFQSGYLYNSLNFPNHGYVYRCEVSLTGNNGSLISFEPGCIFWLADNQYMQFYGAVQAIGTESLPIIFTRYPSSTAYWQGIRVFSSSWDADFYHCQILYAGSADTYSQRRAFCNSGAANLTLSDCLISYSYGHGLVFEDMQSSDVALISGLSIQDASYCGFLGNNIPNHGLTVNGLNIINVGDYPIAVSADLLDSFNDVSMSGVGNPYIAITSYYQTRTATWPDFGLPYRFSNGFTVNDGVTLNIAAGCELVFPNYVLYSVDSYFYVNGALNTLGTEAQPVIFRGLDPNLPSTWVGLRIYNPDAVCNLNWTTIMNAGLDENHTPPQEFCLMYIYRGTVNLNNCTLKLSNHNLLKIEDNNTTTLTGCTLSDAGNGILHYYGTLNLVNNTITNCSANSIYQSGGILNFGSSLTQWNKLYNNGINIYNNTTTPFMAAFVYWGNTDPEDIDPLLFDNEEGKGEISFEPWLDESCQNLYYYTVDMPLGVQLTTLSASQIRLAWSAVTNATSYKVLAASSPDSTEWTVLQQNITGLATDLTVSDNLKFYKVVAVR